MFTTLGFITAPPGGLQQFTLILKVGFIGLGLHSLRSALCRVPDPFYPCPWGAWCNVDVWACVWRVSSQ